MIECQDLLLPGKASPRKGLCSKLHRALTKVRRELVELSLDPFKSRRREESLSETAWANKHLPCSNTCSLPTVCVDTRGCQCVFSSCIARPRFPFQAYANWSTLAFPTSRVSINSSAEGQNSLVRMIKNSEVSCVSRLTLRLGWPKIRVGNLRVQNQVGGRRKPRTSINSDRPITSRLVRG
jgi:hypothetical protein